MSWRDWIPGAGDLRQRRRNLAKKLVARAGRTKATEIYQLVDAMSNKDVRLFEALSGTAFGDWGTGGDAQLSGYTRLTGRNKKGQLLRDMTPMSQEQQTQVAHFLYATNPLAGWLIDQRVDLLIPGEVGYSIEFDPEKLEISPQKAKDRAAEAKEILDKFWEHPAHNVRFRGREYITTLMVNGELCLPIAQENEVDGVPQLDVIDSQMIADVLPLDESSMVAGTVLVRRKQADIGEPKPLSVIRYDQEAERLVGECFFWRNSRILNSMRGRSELLRPADFLDSLDQVLFANVDRAMLLNAVVWRLKMEGATDEQIKVRVEELRGNLGKPGTVFGHNEKGDLEAVSPNLGSYEVAALARLIGNHIRGGASMPESWFGDAGEANRSTASDQTDVTFKTLEAWQTFTKLIFTTLLHYAYDNMQDLQGGAGFPKRSAGGVKLEADLVPVRERDMTGSAQTAVQLEASLEAAVAAEFVSKKTSRKVFLQVLEKLSGTAVDPDDEEQQIELERKEQEKLDAKRQADAARDRLQGQLDDEGNPLPEPGGQQIPPPPPVAGAKAPPAAA